MKATLWTLVITMAAFIGQAQADVLIVRGSVGLFPDTLANGDFKKGDPFSFTFEFDPATPDSNPAANFGRYVTSKAVGSLLMGTYALTSVGGEIQVTNNYPGVGFDRYEAGVGVFNGTLSGASIAGLFPLEVYLSMDDLNGAAFASDALPTSLPAAQEFSPRSFRLAFAQTFLPGIGAIGVQTVFGTVDAVSVVPEPSAVALALAGLGCLATARRWRGRPRV